MGGVGGSNSTCRLGGTGHGARKSRHGDVRGVLWAGSTIGNNVSEQGSEEEVRTRNRYGIGNGHAGIQRAPCAPDENRRGARTKRFEEGKVCGAVLLPMTGNYRIWAFGSCAHHKQLPHFTGGRHVSLSGDEYRGVRSAVGGQLRDPRLLVYVSGWIPQGKDPEKTDAKLIERYGIDVSKWTRCRRKKAGAANVQYLRHDRFFVLLATRGQHPFSLEPGFGTSGRNPSSSPATAWVPAWPGWPGPCSVRLSRWNVRRLQEHLGGLALRREVGEVASAFRTIPAAPYAPVRVSFCNCSGK